MLFDTFPCWLGADDDTHTKQFKQNEACNGQAGAGPPDLVQLTNARLANTKNTNL